MSKKPAVSPKLEKFLEERREIERQHLEYLRESRRAYLEKERAARDRTHGSPATYDLPAPATHAADALRYVRKTGPSTAAPVPTTDAVLKYLTLEEAMKLHREEEARKFYTVKPMSTVRWMAGSPVRIEKNVRITALSDGTYPEVGMRVMHDGVTLEIERIEIETPSWRPVAVGHAVGDMDTFVAGRLYVRAPLDELQPAKAKENVA